MSNLTKEQIEAVSTLIKACKAINATYREDKIVLCDGNEIRLETWEGLWTCAFEGGSYLIPKWAKSLRIQLALLKIHARIIKKQLD